MEFLKRIFKDYRRGASNPAEKKMLDAWYRQTGQRPTPEWMTEEHLQQIKAASWQQLTARFGWPAESASEARQHHPVIRLRSLLPYAAILVVTLAGLATFRWGMHATGGKRVTAGRQTYATTIGIRKKLTLPDGTTVWLNNGTRLTLSLREYIGSGRREVWLEEGEAYFEVAKNPARPFLVHIDSLQARVLGTAFSIQAYRQLTTTQVAVSSGSVQVMASGRVLDTLVRNRALTWYNKGGFFVDTKLTGAQPQWWSNRFVLDKAGFSELALRLRLKFGVRLQSGNRRILRTSFSAGFPDSASLEQVLAVLCTIYKTSYRKEGTLIVIH